MNTLTKWLSLGCLITVAGCSTGSPYQPGPRAGTAVGAGVGLVAGNVAGFGTGVVAGTCHGFASVQDPSYHMVRQWHTETTSDGRSIQVPQDTLVDTYGRPSYMSAP